MNSKPHETAAKALDTLEFWAEKLKRIGSNSDIAVLLAGLTTDGSRLVFFVSKHYIVELFEWAQHNRGDIGVFGMETFTVPGQVTMSTGSGKTVSYSTLTTPTYMHGQKNTFCAFQLPSIVDDIV